ncbi:MAG: hypothetical protein JSS82_14065 [Bacteroidetes bacterium]|nr:hypothetical protein [Bacteroidota bacterium]
MAENIYRNGIYSTALTTDCMETLQKRRIQDGWTLTLVLKDLDAVELLFRPEDGERMVVFKSSNHNTFSFQFTTLSGEDVEVFRMPVVIGKLTRKEGRHGTESSGTFKVKFDNPGQADASLAVYLTVKVVIESDQYTASHILKSVSLGGDPRIMMSLLAKTIGDQIPHPIPTLL